MTETEFIAKEIAIWGEDYVFDLFNKGYVPTFVPDLNKWVFMVAVRTPKMSYVG